ncbi:MAG: HAMP domain-containing histidine kinase [Actinobacteria bacterium]|nr:HAMP domain-containing histidine kinase [Actinomycetota bacterium]
MNAELPVVQPFPPLAEMLMPALLTLAGALALGIGATAIVMRLGSLRARVAGALLIAAALPLIAVLSSGLVMFESEHDLTVLAVASGSAAVAIVAAFMLLRGVSRPLDRLAETAHEIAAGDLGARAGRTGMRETDELADAFNTMAGSVESLFDARRQLVAWASHDLRTPLAAMQAILEGIEDGVLIASEHLPALADQVERLSQLVDDLFELAMIEASALRLEFDEVRVGDLIGHCVRGFEGQARAGRVQLETRIEDPEALVRCAPDKVERVVMNLLTNALRHTPADGTVAVLAERSSGELRIRVEDSGSGLEPHDREHVFDHFYRGDEARGGDGGAGLGLAIAKGLVEAHGGKIWVEDNAAGGATFAFTLPAAV